MKILVVEDSNFARSSILEVLKENFPDVAIFVAGDGVEGYNLYQQEGPELIITDLLMPGMSGQEFIQKIRMTDIHTMIIVLTADSQQATRNEMEKLGILTFINKPLLAEKVAQMVTAIKSVYVLTPMQKDVLTELVNIYIGHAAALLSEMTDQEVELSVPGIELVLTADTKLSSLYDPEVFANGHIISSSLKFGQNFKGKAFLIFPVKQAKYLVSTCLGEEVSDFSDSDERQLLDTDFDVLKEIGNVILNSVISGFGKLLGTYLYYSIPEVELIFVSESDQKEVLHDNSYILILHTTFTLSKTRIKGAIIIALSMNSVSQLLRKIDEMLVENDV